MSGRHGLNDRTVTQILRVLSQFPEVEKAALFGSRAKGVPKPGSDIDLALSGAELDWRVLGRIEEELDDLLLPYGFSLLHDCERTDGEIAGHIRRVGVPFYRREKASLT